MKKILLLAAILYLFLAPLTYHPDNKSVLRWISSDYLQVWNIYEHTQKEFGDGGIFNYPPTNFLLSKIEWPMAKLIGGDGYFDWLNRSDETAVYDSRFFRFNLATKFPLILASLLVGWQIYDLAIKFYNDKKRALLAASLWFFNPITIYSVPIMGQNDVMAIALFLAGWKFIKSHSWLGIIFFGLSISAKSYPLIWIVFLVATMTDWKWTKRIRIVLGAYLVNFLTTLPFITTIAYQTTVVNSAISGRFLIPHISLGNEEAILLVPAALLGFALGILMKLSREKSSYALQTWMVMVVNLLLLGLSHFHPQWFTWIVPFWALWLVSLASIGEIRLKLLFSCLVVIFWAIIIVLFQDKYLTWGIITPLNPNIVNLPLIRDFLVNKDIDVSLMVSGAHTALAVVAIFLSILTMYRKFVWNINNQLLWKRNLLKMSIVVKIGLLTLPTILVFLSFCAGALIPAPIGVLPESSPYYIKFPDSVKSSFIAKEDKLNRIDIFLKNPNLGSFDKFSLNLLNSDGKLVYMLNSSAMNSGDPSLVRFDFPLITNSKGQNYDLLLIRTATEGANRLELGMEPPNFSQIYFRQFYKPTISPTTIISASISNFSSLIRQLWWWYLLLHIGLISLLFRRTSND